MKKEPLQICFYKVSPEMCMQGTDLMFYRQKAVRNWTTVLIEIHTKKYGQDPEN